MSNLELQQAWQRLRGAFTPETLAVVASAALDREQVEGIIVALTAQDGSSVGDLARLSRQDLVEQVISAFFSRADGAERLVAELDRATRTEKSLVSAISAQEVAARFGSHDILKLRRLGAKLAWVMLRDERPELRQLSERILAEYIAHAKRSAGSRRAAEEKGPADEEFHLEELYRQAAQRALNLELEISAVEQERARLVAEVGRRELESRRQKDRQEALAAQLQRVREEIASSREPPAEDQVTAEVKRQLRKAERRLAAAEQEKEALAAARARVAEVEEENARLRRTLDQLRELRASERKARRHAGPSEMSAESTNTKPVVEAPRRGRAKGNQKDVRVGLFVDIANLSGAGRRVYGGAVDYRRLLDLLVSGRRLVEARAYAIDKGRGFDAFACALRAAGYKVTAKKPKLFPDGEMKADWDVGIAVDMMAKSERMDVVVLGSGDGDFTPAILALKKKGLQVEAAGFPDRAAEALVRAVDRFWELDRTVLEH